jgi:transmembrane sensor
MFDIFHISKLIIKKELRILTDSDKLQLKKFNKEYKFLKEVKIQKLVDKIESYSTINEEQAWESIEKKSLKRKTKSVLLLFNKSWYKYAAVFIIGILTATYLFENNLGKIPEETNPIIVDANKNIIQSGTNKAVLTLDDGSSVALDNGSTYQTQNVISNGEQIIYETNKVKSNEIAYNHLTIPRGGQFLLVLADGTKVWLNSESQLKYPTSFIEGETRKVELIYGEAYFEVSPSIKHNGAKFKVHTLKQEVEVLGTEFNIKAYKDEANIYTTLVEGKVVINNGFVSQKLFPSQQSNLNIKNNTIAISSVDVYSVISWKKGLFSFKGKPLKEIMNVLARWYDFNFEFTNSEVENIKFNGVLSKNQTIDEILKTFKDTKFIKDYDITDKKITIQ